MANSTPKSYHTDPTLYLYTSLTSGSSHIISATSRMQTILKANRVDFQALDVATDEKARMLWGRRAGKRKLPGLVRFGMVVGDLEEVEEWNEYGELQENVNLPGPSNSSAVTPSPSTTNTPSKAPVQQEPTPQVETKEIIPDVRAPSQPEATESRSEATPDSIPTSVDSPRKDAPPPSSESTLAMAMRQAGFEAAKKAGDAKAKARQDELEKLKAKSADLQKLDQSGPTGIPSQSGDIKAEEAGKSKTGADDVAETAETAPLSVEGKEEATQIGVNKSKAEDRENVTNQTASAAEAEMANSAATATTEAAESDVLEGTGQAQPEPAAPSVESEQPSATTGQRHILNPKEAEEETNKAIIADEATHVHIAGSPPPYASPGIKPPKDVDEEEEISSPLKTDLKREVAGEDAESNIAAADSNDERSVKEEGDAGEAEHAKTKDETEDDKSEVEKSAAPSESVGKEEETAIAILKTKLKTAEANANERPVVAEANKPTAVDEEKKEKEKEDDDEVGDEEEKQEDEEKDRPKTKAEEGAASSTPKTETDLAPKPTTIATPTAHGSVDGGANAAISPKEQTESKSAEETEKKTNAQSVTGGDNARESADE